MKTSIAAQTFSNSVAAAMQYLLNSGNLEFKGCEATINFILIINNIFDILNSKSKFGTNFKKPLETETFVEYQTIFLNTTKYLKELYFINKQSQMQLLVESQLKTGYVGFICGMATFKQLFTIYIKNEKMLDYLLGFKFSQDHLELFFSAIKGRGGRVARCTSY